MSIRPDHPRFAPPPPGVAKVKETDGPGGSRSAWLVLGLAAILACAVPRQAPRAVWPKRIPGLGPEARASLRQAWAEAGRTGAGPGASVAAVAQVFLGRPYLGGSLGPDPDPEDAGPEVGSADEGLVCRCDAFDCVTLVESSLALANALHTGGLADYPRHLEAIRYRGGRRAGYPSRLHYFTDWIHDNAAKGYVQDLTEALGGIPDLRPLSFMTAHPAAYPALADPSVFQAVRATEAELSARPRFWLTRDRVPDILPRLESGDILAFTSAVAGLDVCHVGLAWRTREGEVRLLHATSPGGSVQISTLPLPAYLARHPRMTGLLVARPAWNGPAGSRRTPPADGDRTSRRTSPSPPLAPARDGRLIRR